MQDYFQYFLRSFPLAEQIDSSPDTGSVLQIESYAEGAVRVIPTFGRLMNAREPRETIPTARELAQMLARRVVLAVGRNAEATDELLSDPRDPAAAALHSVAALARRMKAKTLDATLSFQGLHVAVDTSEFTPTNAGRAHALVHAAFGRPLVLRAGKVVSFDAPLSNEPALPSIARLVRLQLARARSMEPEALLDQDPEGVHELRIAVRRARAGLRVLGSHGISLPPEVEALRTLGTTAGALRDHDVAVELLAKLELEEEARSGTHKTLEQGRRRAKDAFRRHLQAETHPTLFAQLDQFLISPALAVPYSSAEELLRPHVDVQLKKLRKRLMGGLTTAEHYHDVRRQARRVRDLIELYGAALREGQQRWRGRLQPVQSLLGKLNDLHVVTELLPQAQPTVKTRLRERRIELLAELGPPLALLAVWLR